MESLTGKKLLILGGAAVHIKLVEAARDLGVYTIVTDNLSYDTSPGKQIADEYWDNDIYDILGLVNKCKDNAVNGIIAGWLDPCQRPYNELCNRMGYFCYGSRDQFYKMTDKHAFKKMCVENGVDVIPEYSEHELDCVEYPVFVKPVDSRGSRGQSVCYNLDQLKSAISNAKKESSNGDILIEKYMAGAHEFQATYFFINGEAYLLRTCDSYCGMEENHMEKVVACAISPSRFTNLYLQNAHNRVVKMFKSLGIKNGPIFMQGFEDNGVFRFFDPGLRFPGVDYERIYKKVFGINLMEAMVRLALNGTCGDLALPSDGVWLNGKRAAILFPTIRAGIVSKIDGVKELERKDNVVSLLTRCSEGDVIGWTYNVNQRSAEVDLIAEDTERLKEDIKYIQETLIVKDINNQNMAFEIFDASKLC